MSKDVRFNNKNSQDSEIPLRASVASCDNASNQASHDTDSYVSLKLREEKLDIYKKWIQTGEVKVHKEVITEKKTFTVHVTREELVIEKRAFTGDFSRETDTPYDILRIPIKEERVEVIKHPVVLEDVEVYSRQFQENVHIEEVLKKEKPLIKVTGNPKIISKDIEIHS